MKEKGAYYGTNKFIEKFVYKKHRRRFDKRGENSYPQLRWRGHRQ